MPDVCFNVPMNIFICICTFI